MSYILNDLLPQHHNLVYINNSLIPLIKYRLIQTKTFNEIQLLGISHLSPFYTQCTCFQPTEICLKIESTGSVAKLIRHERFLEKLELNLSDMKNVGTEIIDSLVISSNCCNLKRLDLSNSVLTDSDITLFCTNGQFQISTIILDNCCYISEKSINKLLTASNNTCLSTLQLKGVYRNLGSISLYDVNNKDILLILDRIAITHSKSQTETLRYRELI